MLRNRVVALPQPKVDTELIFVIFVPPPLYWSALTIWLRELRSGDSHEHLPAGNDYSAERAGEGDE